MAKTIKIATLIDIANDFFATSSPSSRLDRINVQDFMEKVLHETGHNAGFDYLQPNGSDSSRIKLHKPDALFR